MPCVCGPLSILNHSKNVVPSKSNADPSSLEDFSKVLIFSLFSTRYLPPSEAVSRKASANVIVSFLTTNCWGKKSFELPGLSPPSPPQFLSYLPPFRRQRIAKITTLTHTIQIFNQINFAGGQRWASRSVRKTTINLTNQGNSQLNDSLPSQSHEEKLFILGLLI